MNNMFVLQIVVVYNATLQYRRDHGGMVQGSSWLPRV